MNWYKEIACKFRRSLLRHRKPKYLQLFCLLFLLCVLFIKIITRTILETNFALFWVKICQILKKVFQDSVVLLSFWGILWCLWFIIKVWVWRGRIKFFTLIIFTCMLMRFGGKDVGVWHHVKALLFFPRSSYSLSSFHHPFFSPKKENK